MATDQEPTITSLPSPAEQMFYLATGHWVAQALSVVAKLGIADQLAGGARSSVELATATDTHEPSLYRLLRTLATFGVLTEDEGQRFSLTPVGAILRSDAQGSLHQFVSMQSEPSFWQGYGALLQAVKTGRSGVEHALGMPLYAYLGQHPEEAARFGRTMMDIHGSEPAAVTAAYDFTAMRSVVDVGGGFGNLLGMILKQNPHLRGLWHKFRAASGSE